MKIIIKFSFVIVFMLHYMIFGMESKKSYKKKIYDVGKHIKTYVKHKKSHNIVKFFFNKVPSSIVLDHFCKDHKQMYIDHWWSLDQLFTEYSPILSVNFTTDYHLAAGAVNGTVSIIDVNKKVKIQNVHCANKDYYDNDFNAIYFYSSESRLALDSQLSSIDLDAYEKYSKKSVQEIMHSIQGNIYSSHFDSINNRLAIGMHDGTVILFDVEKKKEIISFNFKNTCICAVSLDSLGKHLAVGLSNGFLYVLDMKIEEVKLQWETPDYHILSVSFDKTGRYVAASSANSNIYICDLETLNTKIILPHSNILTNKDWINSICFDSSGNYLLCGTSNNAVNIINIRTNDVTTLHHNDSVQSVCFDFDTFLGTGSMNGEIRIYSWFKYHSLSQLMLRKIMNLWWQVKCPNKKICDINTLFIDIAKLFHLNKIKLKKIWKTFPVTMQESIWSTIYSKIQRYGKIDNNK